MKYLKTLGLATAAALASLAFLGTGSASATVLDDANGAMPMGAEIDAEVPVPEVVVFETFEGTVLDKCANSSTFKATTNNKGKAGEPVRASVVNADLTWVLCNNETKTVVGGELVFEWTEGFNGTVKAVGFEVTIKSIFGSCPYGYKELRPFGTVSGGTGAVVKVNSALQSLGGPAGCPKEIRWTATYTVKTPATFKVTKE